VIATPLPNFVAGGNATSTHGVPEDAGTRSESAGGTSFTAVLGAQSSPGDDSHQADTAAPDTAQDEAIPTEARSMANMAETGSAKPSTANVLSPQAPPAGAFMQEGQLAAELTPGDSTATDKLADPATNLTAAIEGREPTPETVTPPQLKNTETPGASPKLVAADPIADAELTLVSRQAGSPAAANGAETSAAASLAAMGGKDLPTGGNKRPELTTAPVATVRETISAAESISNSRNAVVDMEPARPGLEQAEFSRVQELGNNLRQASLGADASLSSASGRESSGPVPLQTSSVGDIRGGNPAAEAANPTRDARLMMRTPAGEAGWGEELQGRVNWLTRNGIQRAEIQLHPAELGSLEIRVSTDKEGASVMFFAPNRAARELIEAEMPRLRELLSEAGVELGQSDVSEQSLAEHRAGSEQETASVAAGKQSDAQTNEPETPASVGSLNDHGGLIDYYI